MSLIIIAVLLAQEFYIWRAHGYRADYNLRQSCIEFSPKSEKLAKKCRELNEKY